MAILYNFEIKLNQLFGAVGYFLGACANERMDAHVPPFHVLQEVRATTQGEWVA